MEGKRQGGGSCQFADGSLFHGEWQEDHWMQTEAEPALCKVVGDGLSSATAGVEASVTIVVGPKSLYTGLKLPSSSSSFCTSADWASSL